MHVYNVIHKDTELLSQYGDIFDRIPLPNSNLFPTHKKVRLTLLRLTLVNLTLSL